MDLNLLRNLPLIPFISSDLRYGEGFVVQELKCGEEQNWYLNWAIGLRVTSRKRRTQDRCGMPQFLLYSYICLLGWGGGHHDLSLSSLAFHD